MKFKKILSFFLIFLLLFSFFSISVYAAESSSEPDNIWDWLKSVWHNITDTFDLIEKFRDVVITHVGDGISDGFSNLWDYLDDFDDYINSIKSLLTNSIPYEIRTGITSVTDYLYDIYDSLLSIASLLKNHLTDSFVTGLKQCRDYISSTYQKLHDLYNVISLGIENKLIDLKNGILNLPTLILDGIKDIFIPDVDTLESDFNAAVKNITSQFGIHFETYEHLFADEIAPEDVVEAYNIPGIGFIKLKFLDTSYLIKGVAYFRPFIRGFLVLLLIFYNWKQAITLFDQNPSITVGAVQGIVSNKESSQTRTD